MQKPLPGGLDLPAEGFLLCLWSGHCLRRLPCGRFFQLLLSTLLRPGIQNQRTAGFRFSR